jgi:hypothetical protein
MKFSISSIELLRNYSDTNQKSKLGLCVNTFALRAALRAMIGGENHGSIVRGNDEVKINQPASCVSVMNIFAWSKVVSAYSPDI